METKIMIMDRLDRTAELVRDVQLVRVKKKHDPRLERSLSQNLIEDHHLSTLSANHWRTPTKS